MISVEEVVGWLRNLFVALRRTEWPWCSDIVIIPTMNPSIQGVLPGVLDLERCINVESYFLSYTL
jgi:hypothetical protein